MKKVEVVCPHCGRFVEVIIRNDEECLLRVEHINGGDVVVCFHGGRAEAGS